MGQGRWGSRRSGASRWILGIIVPAVFAGVLLLGRQSSAQAVQGLAATRVASGLTQPLFVTAPPGDYNRLFIVCQTGQVYILKFDTGLVNPTPFLNIQSRLTATTGEQGLLGLAFDPNYASNGKFYLNFTVPGGAGITHVSQFQVSANPDVADTSVEKILLTFSHPASNHNGGWIAFSPRPNDDHNLYISTGDGGNSNDQGAGHLEPTGNAQSLSTVLGKILRIHVDPLTGTASTPANNPFVNTSGADDRIFCYGLRNPFRNAFDRATGNMFVFDVGQSTREEVDAQLASHPGGGENYEWRLREGTMQTPTIQGQPAVGGNPPANGVEPILDYPRTTGGTVIGGVVYRGRQIPALKGTIVFGDYVAGKIFSLNYDGTTASNFQILNSELNANTSGGFSPGSPSSFGEDANGEIYETDITGGFVNKIVPVTPNVMIDSVTRNPQNGHIVIHGYGVPFKTHHLQFTNDLTQAFGSPGVTITAAGDGSFSYDDPTPGNGRFYRVTYP